MHPTAASPNPVAAMPACFAPGDAASWPSILVVERRPVLSAPLAELFEALHIRMQRVQPGPALAAALRRERPMGVLAHLPSGGTAVRDVLRCVAWHDPGLPVMVVTDPPADAVRAAGDTGKRPLVNMVWLPRLPGLQMVIEFLSMAERRLAPPG